MTSELKNKTVKGVFWSSIERFSTQGVQFVIQILLARILSPAEFGIIGMLAFFIAVSQTLIDSGFSNALIRKTNRTEIDNSTVFYCNIVIGVVLYMLLFFSAPLIAAFYETPVLVPLTRVLGLGLVFNSLSVVQLAILTAKVDFKTQTKASLTSVIISGGIGLWMAHSGYGVWALAVQIVINSILNTALLWLVAKWRPRLVFSRESFRELFSFGSKLLVSGLIDTSYKNVYALVIGKVYSASTLGLYTKANQIAQLPAANITAIMQRVTYPVMCDIGSDDQLRKIYRKYLSLAAYIIFPIMTGIAALASPFINLVLTEKWSDAVILLQIICFAAMLYPVHAINLNLLQVKGRSDLFLRLEIIKKTLAVAILALTIPMGIVYMCTGIVVNSLIGLVINTHYTGKLLGLGLLAQLKDLSPPFLYSLAMGAVILFISRLFENYALQLGAGIVVGVFFYFGISYIFKSPSLKTILFLTKRNSKHE